MNETRIIASENCHWYDKQGNPVYEVNRADGKGKRKATLADARKLDLVPGFTEIDRVAAKPGLESWKLTNMLTAALTLPRNPGESLDDYAQRVILDAETQSKAAMDRGTEVHTAIELYVLGQEFSAKWQNHVAAVEGAMKQVGLNLAGADAEKTFATPHYGGKIDWSTPMVIADFKTKDRIEHGKKLAWDNHARQLAAYWMGLHGELTWNARYLNIFIGVEDCKVLIHEWPFEDIQRGWAMFECLVKFWRLSKGFPV